MVKKRVKRKSYSSSQREFKLVPYPPLSVKVVSIFFYILGIVTCVFGLMVLLAGIFGAVLLYNFNVSQLMQMVPSLSMWEPLFSAGFVIALFIIGIVVILWGIIQILIARGLWKGSKVAFVAAAVLIFISFLTSLILTLTLDFSALFPLILYGLLGYLLFFENGSKRYFGLVGIRARTIPVIRPRYTIRKKRR
jgi:hypothetical protein